MDNIEASKPILKTCRDQNGVYITNRRLFENNENNVRTSFNGVRRSLKLSSNNITYAGETGVGKTKLAKEIAKAF